MAKDNKKAQNKKNSLEKDIKNKENEKEEIKGEIKKEKVEVKKEIIKKKERNNERFNNTLRAIDDNRKAIILFVVGFLIATLLFRCILWPDRIATLKDGTEPIVNLGKKTITADDLYKDMKEYYSVKVLLNKIDDIILTKKYPDTDEMNEKIKDTANYYYTTYEKSYGYTKEQFLSQYGFSSEKDFINDLKLDYRRNLYFDDYAIDLVTDKEIEKYYKDDVFGDVDSKHILVSISKDDDKDGLSDEDAKKLANEIIDKLNKGTSWENVVKEYKDKIVSEELGYKPFNASLESAYLKECKNLEVGTYSKSPVLTSYGYHIVYKIAQKDKPKLKDVKDDIKDILAKQKKDNDSNLYYKALISMRENAKLEFIDTKFNDEYKKYINSYK